ncbi:hypothetical protein Ae168Ps1_2420c [Pseudonocardia sp. Ae168_Ps1]|nr:hypothetical protein Ae168Ps1_2420c [Pseudonocardia sp. Ae168_Ps1]
MRRPGRTTVRPGGAGGPGRHGGRLLDNDHR